MLGIINPQLPADLCDVSCRAWGWAKASCDSLINPRDKREDCVGGRLYWGCHLLHMQRHPLCKIDGRAQEELLQLTSGAQTNQLAQHPNTAPLSLVSKTGGARGHLKALSAPFSPLPTGIHLC